MCGEWEVKTKKDVLRCYCCGADADLGAADDHLMVALVVCLNTQVTSHRRFHNTLFVTLRT